MSYRTAQGPERHVPSVYGAHRNTDMLVEACCFRGPGELPRVP